MSGAEIRAGILPRAPHELQRRTQVGAYITVNGRPLCNWTGCQAGRDDAAKVTSLLHVPCGHERPGYALQWAERWKDAHPSHMVCVALGACPEA